jgi:oligoribonuclease NrnB/cAMP/cGMP phosphodiesterase (DHH superfamily)
MELRIETDYKNILTFTHNDADGILGGFIIKYLFDNNLEDSAWDMNVKTYCCSYGKSFNLSWFKQKTEEFIEEYQENIKVCMIDYAIQPNNDMIKFYNWCQEKEIEFEWIDHHITAIENLKHFNIPGLQHSTYSGCLNTWNHFSKDEPPTIIKMVCDFDIWNKSSSFSWDDQLFPIVYFINSLGLDLNNNEGDLVKQLKLLFDKEETLNKCIDIGKYISRYVGSLYSQNLKKIYNIKWNDYDCLVLNTTFPGSTQFSEHPDFKNVDLCLTWSFDGKYYYYGAYTTKTNIDVGYLCQQHFNGGGHKGCGGGQLKEFILH